MDIRQDKGSLFENFVIIERMKKNHYGLQQSQYYFWKTYGGAEIDLVELRDGILHGYEIKANKKLKNPPTSWKDNYPNSTYTCINMNNYLEHRL
ncbi:MAG: DUF4143 domain-containing protein [Saprospiraceae bacterium]